MTKIYEVLVVDHDYLGNESRGLFTSLEALEDAMDEIKGELDHMAQEDEQQYTCYLVVQERNLHDKAEDLYNDSNKILSKEWFVSDDQ